MIYGYSLGVLVQWIDWFDRHVDIYSTFLSHFSDSYEKKLTQLASTDYKLKKLANIDLNFLFDSKGCKKLPHKSITIDDITISKIHLLLYWIYWITCWYSKFLPLRSHLAPFLSSLTSGMEEIVMHERYHDMQLTY